MADMFDAICVGGPLDRMRISSKELFVEVAMKQKTWPLEHTTPVSEVPKTIRYKRFEFCANGAAFRLWAPEDKDEAFILRNLITAYDREKEKQ